MFYCFTHLSPPEIGLFCQWYKNYVTVCQNRSALLKCMLKWEAEVVCFIFKLAFFCRLMAYVYAKIAFLSRLSKECLHLLKLQYCHRSLWYFIAWYHSRAMFLNPGDTAPQGTFGSVWGHFWLWQGRGYCWFEGRRPGLLLKMPQCTGQLHNKVLSLALFPAY